jgi:hypothetical protein
MKLGRQLSRFINMGRGLLRRTFPSMGQDAKTTGAYDIAPDGSKTTYEPDERGVFNASGVRDKNPKRLG